QRKASAARDRLSALNVSRWTPLLLPPCRILIPSKRLRSIPCAILQVLTPSWPPTTRSSPLSVNASENTLGQRMVLSSALVARFQTVAPPETPILFFNFRSSVFNLSAPPAARRLPSALNATAKK